MAHLSSVTVNFAEVGHRLDIRHDAANSDEEDRPTAESERAVARETTCGVIIDEEDEGEQAPDDQPCNIAAASGAETKGLPQRGQNLTPPETLLPQRGQ